MPKFNIILSVIILSVFVGCGTVNENNALPSAGARDQAVAAYQACVSTVTYNIDDKFRNPDSIIDQSMKSCTYMRDDMLRDYPIRWRKPYLQKINRELHKREMAWILNNRNK